MYPAAALYPGSSLASYNPSSFDGNPDNNRGGNNPSNPATPGNVKGNDSESPVTSVGRVRAGGSSVGSEGDISLTLSPGNGSSGIRENQDGSHSADNSNRRGPASALPRWDGSNGAMAAALEAVVNRSSRETMEQQIDQMGRSNSVHSVGSLQEDVWRPYWINPSTT